MYSGNSNHANRIWQHHVVRSKISFMIQETKGHKGDLTERNYEIRGDLRLSRKHFLVGWGICPLPHEPHVNRISFETGSCDWESTWRKPAKGWGIGQIHPQPAAFPLRYCVTTQNTYTRTINRIAMQLEPRLCLMNNLANRPRTGYSCGYSTDILWMGLLIVVSMKFMHYINCICIA